MPSKKSELNVSTVSLPLPPEHQDKKRRDLFIISRTTGGVTHTALVPVFAVPEKDSEWDACPDDIRIGQHEYFELADRVGKAARIVWENVNSDGSEFVAVLAHNIPLSWAQRYLRGLNRHLRKEKLPSVLGREARTLQLALSSACYLKWRIDSTGAFTLNLCFDEYDDQASDLVDAFAEVVDSIVPDMGDLVSLEEVHSLAEDFANWPHESAKVWASALQEAEAQIKKAKLDCEQVRASLSAQAAKLQRVIDSYVLQTPDASLTLPTLALGSYPLLGFLTK